MLSLVACATAPRGNAADHAELLAAREAVWRAWFGGDVATLDALLPDDFIAIDPTGGIARGKQGQIDGARQFSSSGGKLLSLRFPETAIPWQRDAALIWTTFELEVESGGSRQLLRGRASEWFEWRGGRLVHPGWHMDFAP